jgi:hypothetical protein
VHAFGLVRLFVYVYVFKICSVFAVWFAYLLLFLWVFPCSCALVSVCSFVLWCGCVFGVCGVGVEWFSWGWGVDLGMDPSLE